MTKKSFWSIITSLVFAVVLLVAAVPTAAAAQQQQTTTSNRIFESENFDYRLQIPQGWVIQEEEVAFEDPSLKGSQVLAMLCQESEDYQE